MSDVRVLPTAEVPAAELAASRRLMAAAFDDFTDDGVAAINDVVRARFELGVLSTGEWHFYERLGWERWQGRAFVRGRDGVLTRAEEEDDGVMVLRCGASAAVDPTAPIACDERDGDSW